MKGKKTEFMIDFNRLKKRKQYELHQIFADLYEGLFHYIETEANLREKVRAKEIYRYKTGLKKDQMMTKEEEVQFEHWFAFDHITVIGSRMFDLFVRERQGEMSQRMLEMAGILMLMHLQPYRVLNVEEDGITAVPLYQPDRREILIPFMSHPLPEESDLIMARTMKIGFEKKLIGPAFSIDSKWENYVTERLAAAHEQGQLAYRKYLKEYGIDFRKYRRTSLDDST